MKFWEILFSIISILMIPRKIVTKKFNGGKVRVIFVVIMPWAPAMTIGRNIYTTGNPSNWLQKEDAMYYHELQHVKHWQKHGFSFAFKYLASSAKALLSGKRFYYDNEFEKEAYLKEYEYRRQHKKAYIDRYK